MAESWICRCSRGTLYDVLQVSPWCEPEVVQAAYRALARSRHPDVNRDPDAEDQMRRLNVAYQVLSDPARRTRYDEELALESARPMPGRGVVRTAETPRASTPVVEPRGPIVANAAPTRHHATPSSPARSLYAVDLDGRESAILPRSVLYVSVVLVTAILVLVLWLILDAFIDRPTPGFRAGYASEEHSTVSDPRSPWPFGGQSPSSQPGLSHPAERWNR